MVGIFVGVACNICYAEGVNSSAHINGLTLIDLLFVNLVDVLDGFIGSILVELMWVSLRG